MASPINNNITYEGESVWTLSNSYNNVTKKNLVTSGKINSSTRLYCVGTQSSTDIFNTPNQSYSVRLVIGVGFNRVDGVYPNNGIVQVAFKVGKNSEVIKSFNLLDNPAGYDDLYELNFYYSPTKLDLLEDGAKKFYIRRVGGGRLRLIETEVLQQNINYSELNNSLYPSISGGNISLPNGINLFSPSENGDKLSIRYGNGFFKSGIWENGIWNNGFRSALLQDDLFYFNSIDSGSTYQENNNSWFIKITPVKTEGNIDNIKSSISVGDYVSVGNIVGINFNENRKLLSDVYRVVRVYTDSSILLNIIVNFPIRRFELDSSNHLLYVTKNIWKNGVFLNGYFRGVWSGGLFKGFPNTTIMQDSQWINGKFDGGRFISSTQSTLDNLGNTVTYNTGLIQNFQFYDNNTTNNYSNGVIGNLYNSWIDVNYYTSSYVNINNTTKIYDKDLKSAKALSNLYGLPTDDVLSSISYFRNSSNNDVNSYELGNKWTIYQDFIGDNTNFNRPFSNIGTLNEELGLDEFYNKGWQINFGPFYDAVSSTTFSYSSNTDTKNIDKLDILANRYGYNLINNEEVNILDKRYSLVEYKLDLFKNGANSFEKPINLLGSRYNAFYNDYQTGLVKREYFYNKDRLDMFIKFSSQFDVSYPSQYLYVYNQDETQGETQSFISGGLGVDIPLWTQDGVYDSGALVRTEWDDVFGNGIIYESYLDGLQSDPRIDTTNWLPALYGFNVGDDLPNEELFGLADSLQLLIPYIKFYEIDKVPFFNYYFNELSFTTTFKSTEGNLALRFDSPHGMNIGDIIEIKIDELKFNISYNGTCSVVRQVDGPAEYYIVTSKTYGFTSPSLSETGVCRNLTNPLRIDTRIKNNLTGISPIVIQGSSNFSFIDNNPQTSIDVNIIQSQN